MALVRVEKATNVFNQDNFWLLGLNELSKAVEEAGARAVQAKAGQRSAGNRYVLTWKTPAPHLCLWYVSWGYFVDVLSASDVGPVHVEHFVAIVVNLADIADFKPGILETKIEPADAGEERIHM